MSGQRLGLDAVMALIANYASSLADEQEARGNYDGWSWDYHGASYLDEIERTKAAAEAALNDYISEVVRREVAKATGQ